MQSLHAVAVQIIMTAQDLAYIPRLDTYVFENVISSSVCDAFTSLGYTSPTELRSNASCCRLCVAGLDVFAVLPTGSGKSLCFVALPLVFEKLRGDQGLSFNHCGY